MKLFDGWTKEQIIEWLERHPEPDCGVFAMNPKYLSELPDLPNEEDEEEEKDAS